MAKFNFDVTEVEVSERGDFEVMPKGEYTLKATEAEAKESSKGGTYIAAEFEVAKGEFTGRKVWQNFNVVCSSEKAEKIGREQIAGWARACGKPNAKDTDELLERNFQCKLGIEKGTGGYSDRNKIDSFLLPEGAAAKKPAAVEKASEETATAKSTPTQESTGKKADGGKKNPWD